MQASDLEKWQQIGPLADFLQDESVLGAVRFTICPSFASAIIFNFIYSKEGVRLFKLVDWNVLV